MKNNIEDLIQSHIIIANKLRPIGYDGRIRIQYFVDFFTACYEREKREQLVSAMVDNICHYCDLDDYDGIACPKDGNILLAYEVAKALQMSLVYVRKDVLFGRWVDGALASGCKLILVDDCAIDGEIITENINNARRSGFVIDKVFTLIDRKEGDASLFLEALDVPLYSLDSYSDVDLRTLVK